MLDGKIMDDIHTAAAKGKDTLAPSPTNRFSDPYWKDQSWFVDEFVSIDKGYISRRFDSRAEADEFVEAQNAD